jgi:hypothetical protein
MVVIVIMVAHGAKDNRVVLICRGRHGLQTGMGAATLSPLSSPKIVARENAS